MDYVSVGVKTDKLDSIVTNVRDKDVSLMPQIYNYVYYMLVW